MVGSGLCFFFFLVACRPNLKDLQKRQLHHLFYDSAALVQSISIHTTSGDEVDFILKESSWVNKDNQAMNTSFADEMLDALHNASFEPSRKVKRLQRAKRSEIRVCKSLLIGPTEQQRHSTW